MSWLGKEISRLQLVGHNLVREAHSLPAGTEHFAHVAEAAEHVQQALNALYKAQAKDPKQ